MQLVLCLDAPAEAVAGWQCSCTGSGRLAMLLLAAILRCLHDGVLCLLCVCCVCFCLAVCLQDGDASKDASYRNVYMQGQDVFKFAVRSVPSVIDAALRAANMDREEVDWLVMHQANQRILDAAAQRLGLPAERVSGRGVPERVGTSTADVCRHMDRF